MSFKTHNMKQLACLIMCIFFAFSTVFLYVTALDVAFAMYSGYYTTELFGLRAEMTLLSITVFVFILSVFAFIGYYLLYTGHWDTVNQEDDLTEEERRIEAELSAYESMYM